jgi:N-6 DNA Methylase
MSFAADCSDYLESISRDYKSGVATESSYYSALKHLVQAFANRANFNTQIIIAPKKTENGLPDLILRRDLTVGHIEAKDIPFRLADVEKTDQIKKYLKAFPNLVLTDFFTFWLYRNGKKIDSATLADKSRLLREQIIPRATGLNEVQRLFNLFCSFLPIPAINAEQLARQLAIKAKQLSVIVFDEIVSKNLFFEEVYRMLKEHLIASLTHQTFADVYSQTLAYGLFAAKIEAANKNFERANAYDYLPTNMPLLTRLFYIMQDPNAIVSLKWVLDDIVNVLNSTDIKSILTDFHAKTWSDDPVAHFYETFLSAYDPKLRKDRGVYSTPTPVVAYIIKSIQQILVKEFAIPDGLADSRILLLDPAAGSLTFPVLAIKLVKDLCVQQDKAGIFPSLVREHILKNFFGFELLLAPYVIGHLKAKLTLTDLGCQIDPNDRFQLYLTNALEPGIPSTQRALFPELINEARNASRIKDQEPIVVICGNPPYFYSSDNKSHFIETLMEDYKTDVRNEKNLQPLDNDYIKFLRFAQWKIAEKTHHGIVGMITDNSYLDGLIHRGIRGKLLGAFDQVIILNLHGNSRSLQKLDGQKDENIFDIQQGVAIVFLIKKEGTKKVLYADLYGTKEEKYQWLSTNDLYSTNWQSLDPKSPFFWFFPKKDKKEYQDFYSLDQMMPFHQQGIKTHRDWLVVGYEDSEIKSRIESLRRDPEDKIMIDWKLSERNRPSISNAKS